MRHLLGFLFAAAVAAPIPSYGQQQRGRPDADPSDRSSADPVTRMMTFDSDKDGKLSKAEVTDERLHRLFARADADKDGFVTKEELTKLAASVPAARAGFGGPGGGIAPFGGRGGPPAPGQVLPQFLQDELKLTTTQQKQLAELQKEVDTRLDKILTAEQKQTLQRMRERGPGGPGRPFGGDNPPRR